MSRSLIALGLLAAASAAVILPVHAATEAAPQAAVEIAQAGPPGPPPGEGRRGPPPGRERADGPDRHERDEHRRHGGRHGMRGEMKERLAERFAAQEQILGIRSDQLDAWRAYTAAALAMLDGPAPFARDAADEGEPREPGDKPPFMRAERMADAVLGRAETAQRLKDAVAALRTTLTPEQLEAARELDKQGFGKHRRGFEGRGFEGRGFEGRGFEGRGEGRGPRGWGERDERPRRGPPPPAAEQAPDSDEE